MHSQTASKLNCQLCNGNHVLYKCNTYSSKSVEDGKAFITQKHLCFKCLGNHLMKDCKSKNNCFVCHGSHHTSLHMDKPANSKKVEKKEPQPSTSSALTTVMKVVKSHLNALLSTARVKVCQDGQHLKVRALVDQCAQSSFITEELCQRLRLRKRKINIPIRGIGKKKINCQAEVETIVRPHFSSQFACTFNAYVLPRITAYEPISIDTSDWNHIKDLQLADPEFGEADRIDVLLGMKVHAMIIQEGLRKGQVNMPIALKTSLGWILSSTSKEQSTAPTVHVQAIDLDDRL